MLALEKNQGSPQYGDQQGNLITIDPKSEYLVTLDDIKKTSKFLYGLKNWVSFARYSMKAL